MNAFPANKPELLAPCGGFTEMQAALDAGADAVYFGIDRFNMRASASRCFTVDSVDEVSERCHAAGAKCYLTLNSIIYEGEIPQLRSVVEAVAGKVDAVIASDWCVIQSCREAGVPFHCSTQMSCSNSASALFLASQGAERIVLARECAMPEIKTICGILREHGVEVEIFVHGAQCVAESGRCFMSHHAYGASANRGECFQPCRRFYYYAKERREGDPLSRAEFEVEAHTILSASDLCSLPFLDKVIATGAASLKIEGRARPPEYVSTVVRAYRQAIDAVFSDQFREPLISELVAQCERVYHRKLSSGLFHGRPGAEQFADDTENLATVRKYNIGIVQHDYTGAGIAQILVQDNTLKLGDTISIQGPTTGEVQFKVESIRQDDLVLSSVSKGQWCTMPRPSRVRTGDRVYLLVEKHED